MPFILIPHVFDGQNAWERPKRAPKLRKIVPFPRQTAETAQPLKVANLKK